MYNYRMLAEGLETQVRLLQEERDALAEKLARAMEALETYATQVEEYTSDNPVFSDCAYDWLNDDAGQLARTTLAAIKEGYARADLAHTAADLERAVRAVNSELDEFAKNHDFGDRTGEFVHTIVASLRPRLTAAILNILKEENTE